MNNSIFSGQNLIYLITEGNATPENFSEQKIKILEIIKKAVFYKIPLIQIREKAIPARFVYEIAAEAAGIAKNSKTKILINDRADIAFAAKADGVHLTSNSIPTEEIRGNFPENFMIGVSVHSLDAAEKAKKNGADFVTFSPIFSTPSKSKYGAPQGIIKLREVCQKMKNFPVIALGGIDETNYLEVLENGANGFAAIRFLNEVENLRKLSEKSKNERTN